MSSSQRASCDATFAFTAATECSNAATRLHSKGEFEIAKQYSVSLCEALRIELRKLHGSKATEEWFRLYEARQVTRAPDGTLVQTPDGPFKYDTPWPLHPAFAGRSAWCAFVLFAGSLAELETLPPAVRDEVCSLVAEYQEHAMFEESGPLLMAPLIAHLEAIAQTLKSSKAPH